MAKTRRVSTAALSTANQSALPHKAVANCHGRLRRTGNTGAHLEIAIMGSGGISGYYGARLQQGGADVTFIARGEQLKAFRQNGIALEGDRPIHLPSVKATDDPATIGKVDMVIFSVKLRDTEAAAKQILSLIGPDTGIISLQNGVTKDDMLAPIVGRQHLLGGAAYMAAC